jgi:ActR/RegA family two-component response regulator
MNAVLLSRDLMLQSRADGAARKVGLTLRIANDVAVALESARDEACRGIVIDLRFPQLDIGSLIPQLRSARADEFFIVACGPHVHETSLNAAREAGCDLVATRGQFDRDAEEILRRFVAVDEA